MLGVHLGEGLAENTLKRLRLLVSGILKGKSAGPAAIAKALRTLGLSEAQVDSIERRVRRIENDPDIRATLCFHPLAKARLAWGKPEAFWPLLPPLEGWGAAPRHSLTMVHAEFHPLRIACTD